MRKDSYVNKTRIMKKQVKGNTYPPTFRMSKFKGKTMNCYAYCFDVAINDTAYDFLFPGCISRFDSPRDLYTEEQVISGFIRDAQYLGFSVREDDGRKDNSEYRVAVYIHPAFHDYPLGFHFSRQDADGTWSEKLGWDGPVQKNGIEGDIPENLEAEFMRLEKVFLLKKKEQ